MSFTARLLAMTLLVAGCAERKPVAMEPVTCILNVGSTSARTDRWNIDAGLAFTTAGASASSTACEGSLADAGSDGTNGGSGSTRNCACPDIGPGKNILMQCRNDLQPLDVYMDSTNVTASNVDQFVSFTTSTDPYPVYLGNSDKQISVLAADGGTGKCSFMPSLRKRPY